MARVALFETLLSSFSWLLSFGLHFLSIQTLLFEHCAHILGADNTHLMLSSLWFSTIFISLLMTITLLLPCSSLVQEADGTL